MKKLSLLTALLIFSASAAASSIDALKAFVADTQTARATFTQTVLDKNGHTRLAVIRHHGFRASRQIPLGI